MDVGVRELKQHLSEFLDRAAAGETILVTDRGVPKVHIVPVPGVGAMDRGVAEGWLRPAVGGRGLEPVRRVKSSRRVTDVLLEDRGE